MSIKLTNKKENGEHVVTMTVTGEDWTNTLEKTKKDLMKNLEIKGFRKGHVPTNIAEQHINSQIVQGKATEVIIDKEYSKVIEKLQEEKIISRPAINVTKISDTEFEATFTSAIYPEIKLAKTSGFEAKFEEPKVSKKEVEEQIDKIKEQALKTTVDVEDDRELKEGDVADFDFVGKKDGKEFDGGAAKGFELVIGSKQFIPGFEENMIGMKKGESKDIELTFPESYPAEDLAGADVVFEVKLNSIKENKDLEGKELDEKLQSLGYKDFADFESKIELGLKEGKVAQANDKFFNEVVEELMANEGTKMEIPESLIKDELDNQLNNFKQQLSKQGMTLDKYLEMIKSTEEDFVNKNLRETALQRIQHGLIYTQLVEELKATPTEEEIDAKLEEIANMQGLKAKDLKKNIDLNSFNNALMFEKLVDELKK